MATAAKTELTFEEQIFRDAVRHAFKEHVSAIDIALRITRSEWKTLLNQAVDEFFDGAREMEKGLGPSEVRPD